MLYNVSVSFFLMSFFVHDNIGNSKKSRKSRNSTNKFWGGMGWMVLGIDEKFIFREKKGCPPNYFFQKLGVTPNHKNFRLQARRTVGAEKFCD